MGCHATTMADILAAMERYYWLRFELVEHIRLPKTPLSPRWPGPSPLWLDDFGTGMKFFSAERNAL